MGRERFVSDLTNKDKFTRVVKAQRILGTILVIFTLILTVPFILLFDEIIFKLALVLIVGIFLAFTVRSQKKNIRVSMKIKSVKDIEVTKNLVIIPKNFDFEGGKAFTIEISNIRSIDMDASKYIEEEKMKHSWFKRNIWGGYVPNGGLWNGNWPAEYHLLVHLKEPMDIKVPWINPKGFKMEIINQRSDKVLLSLRPEEKERFKEAIERRMVGSYRKPDKRNLKKKEKTILEINTTPRPKEAWKKGSRYTLTFFFYIYLFTILLVVVISFLSADITMKLIVFSLIMGSIMTVVFGGCVAFATFWNYRDMKKKLLKVADENKMIIRSRTMMIESKESRSRIHFKNLVPIDYIRSIGGNSIREEHADRYRLSWRKFVKGSPPMDERYICHTDSPVNTLLSMKLSKTVKVRVDPLARRTGLVYSIPNPVNVIVVSIPPEEQRTFIETLLELNEDIQVLD